MDSTAARAITPAEWMQVIVYCLLVALWLSVFVATLTARFFRDRVPTSRLYKQAHIAFLVVAGVLCFDSGYWAIVNIAKVGVIDRRFEASLRNPAYVAAVKSTVLCSSLVFLWLMVRIGRDIRARLASVYFHGLIDQTWDAIGILDRDGVMRRWNTGAERLFGFRREEVEGKHIDEFLVPNDEELRKTTRRLLLEARSTKRAVRYRQPRRRSDGTTIDVDIVSSPILLEDGTFEGYFGIMRRALIEENGSEPQAQK